MRVGQGRAERLTLLAHMLATAPGRMLALGKLADAVGVAKSTLSEDLRSVNRGLQAAGLGEVASFTGAAGGVVYRPEPDEARVRDLAASLSAELGRVERRIAGGFLYTTDLVFSPSVAREVGEVFAGRYFTAAPDVVVTVETKGIPLALMTAHALGVPLVTVRRETSVTEGPALGINYLSGTSRVQTMSLPRRALNAGARVLLVDDFLKAGGTAHGLMDLMDEFGAEVVGLAVLIETAEPEHKMVTDHFALLRMTTGADRIPVVTPSPRLGEARGPRPRRTDELGGAPGGPR